MAQIKNAIYKVHNGIDFDTMHFETKAEQVKFYYLNSERTLSSLVFPTNTRGAVRMSSNQSIPANVYTPIRWGSGLLPEVAQVVNNRIKILQSGLYRIQAEIAFAGNPSGRRSYWGQTTHILSPTNDSTNAYMTIVEFAELTAGDLLNCRVQQRSGGALDLLRDYTQLSIWKIGDII